MADMTTQRDALATLHTTLVDSRKGYEEAMKDAGKNGLIGLFEEMKALRQAAAVELETLVRQAGAVPDSDGSFMSTIHRTIISFQSMINGLDENALPGFIDGEKRILETYDEAIRVTTGPALAVLHRQRQELVDRIAEMERRRDKAA